MTNTEQQLLHACLSASSYLQEAGWCGMKKIRYENVLNELTLAIQMMIEKNKEVQ